MDDLEQIEKLEKKLNAVNLSDTDDEPLEIVKTIKKKRVLSEKQLEVLSNARIKLKEKNKERQAKKKLESDAIENEVQNRFNEYKTSLEQKIVKKAISIKKKDIKKQAILEEISDDETPIQKIKEIAKRIPTETKAKYVYV